MKHPAIFYIRALSRSIRDCIVGLCLDIRHSIYGFEYIVGRLPNLNEKLLIRTLMKYGAQIGSSPKICRGLIIHNAEDGFGNLIIGNNCHVGVGCFLDLRGRVTIGDYSVISMKTTIITHTDLYHSSLEDIIEIGQKDVSIGDNVYIGACTTILMGVHIGDHTIIGASSLVTKDVPSGVISAGQPAKILRPIA